MPIPQRPFFPQTSGTHPPRPQAGTPVLAVGRRMLVNCPGDGMRRVTLTDGNGSTALATLADGTEVEIVAWHPRGAGGTRYRIRATAGGIQGWLAAADLRPCPAPPPPPVVRAPAAAPRPAPSQAKARPRPASRSAKKAKPGRR